MSRFIKEQLSLEAEAREALPYVGRYTGLMEAMLTFNSNSTLAHAISVLFVKVYTHALLATLLPRLLPKYTSPLASATRARYHVMVNILSWSFSTSATSFVIVGQIAYRRRHPAHSV